MNTQNEKLSWDSTFSSRVEIANPTKHAFSRKLLKVCENGNGSPVPLRSIIIENVHGFCFNPDLTVYRDGWWGMTNELIDIYNSILQISEVKIFIAKHWEEKLMFFPRWFSQCIKPHSDIHELDPEYVVHYMQRWLYVEGFCLVCNNHDLIYSLRSSIDINDESGIQLEVVMHPMNGSARQPFENFQAMAWDQSPWFVVYVLGDKMHDPSTLVKDSLIPLVARFMDTNHLPSLIFRHGIHHDHFHYHAISAKEMTIKLFGKVISISPLFRIICCHIFNFSKYQNNLCRPSTLDIPYPPVYIYNLLDSEAKRSYIKKNVSPYDDLSSFYRLAYTYLLIITGTLSFFRFDVTNWGSIFELCQRLRNNRFVKQYEEVAFSRNQHPCNLPKDAPRTEEFLNVRFVDDDRLDRDELIRNTMNLVKYAIRRWGLRNQFYKVLDLGGGHGIGLKHYTQIKVFDRLDVVDIKFESHVITLASKDKRISLFTLPISDFLLHTLHRYDVVFAFNVLELAVYNSSTSVIRQLDRFKVPIFVIFGSPVNKLIDLAANAVDINFRKQSHLEMSPEVIKKILLEEGFIIEDIDHFFNFAKLYVEKHVDYTFDSQLYKGIYIAYKNISLSAISEIMPVP